LDSNLKLLKFIITVHLLIIPRLAVWIPPLAPQREKMLRNLFWTGKKLSLRMANTWGWFFPVQNKFRNIFFLSGTSGGIQTTNLRVASQVIYHCDTVASKTELIERICIFITNSILTNAKYTNIFLSFYPSPV
jgi:hypothetical protein